MPAEWGALGHIVVKSSAAVALAAVGEVAAERSGVLNLGVEGMMLIGALAGAAAGLATGNPYLGLAAGALAGACLAGLHAVFAIALAADQTLSGLALAILGAGLANFLGRPLVGAVGLRLPVLPVPGLADLPFLGPVLFRHTLPVYLALLAGPLAAWALARTRAGLMVRAVGEDAAAAHAMGVPVAAVRAGCTLFGGLMAGLAGASLSLAYTPGWKENMSGGQGWIAIAMVIFAGWRPLRAALGALLFGALTALTFQFQAAGVELVPIWLLRMLPYLLTVAVLCLALGVAHTRRGGPPADLGRPFRPGD